MHNPQVKIISFLVSTFALVRCQSGQMSVLHRCQIICQIINIT